MGPGAGSLAEGEAPLNLSRAVGLGGTLDRPPARARVGQLSSSTAAEVFHFPHWLAQNLLKIVGHSTLRAQRSGIDDVAYIEPL